MAQESRTVARRERARRTRYKLRQVSGDRLRLSVFRSTKHIYAQIIDDQRGVTLVSASTTEPEIRSQIQHGGNRSSASLVGGRLAEKARQANITRVVFDRGGYLYHGRTKELADAARAGGLEF
ncbi:MAG: 50S ribosomal protein L18 [Magnetococcales bacterium]|nr:50S ribosomal protein L18 [Magnetococcales bacterium]